MTETYRAEVYDASCFMISFLDKVLLPQIFAHPSATECLKLKIYILKILAWAPNDPQLSNNCSFPTHNMWGGIPSPWPCSAVIIPLITNWTLEYQTHHSPS